MRLYMENYKPLISEGVVSLVGDKSSSQKVKILRDTGAFLSLMLDSVLPLAGRPTCKYYICSAMNLLTIYNNVKVANYTALFHDVI